MHASLGGGQLLGGLEGGGSGWVISLCTAGGVVVDSARVPAAGPEETLRAIGTAWRRLTRAYGMPVAVGCASFGPLDLRDGSSTFGRVLGSPKGTWTGFPLHERLQSVLGSAVVMGTDTEGGVLAEVLWGAGRGMASVALLTVGTGVGGAFVSRGRLFRGAIGPEVGHIAVPRLEGDHFEGVCPFHGDCLEGLASGSAIRARYGADLAELAPRAQDAALRLVCRYVAYGIRALVYLVAPDRVICGGGVGQVTGFLAGVRAARREIGAGYALLSVSEPEDLLVSAAISKSDGALAGAALALSGESAHWSPSCLPRNVVAPRGP